MKGRKREEQEGDSEGETERVERAKEGIKKKREGVYHLHRCIDKSIFYDSYYGLRER